MSGLQDHVGDNNALKPSLDCLEWDEELLKLEMKDWKTDDLSYQGKQTVLSGDTQSHQEEFITIASDFFGDERKRSRRHLENEQPDNNLGETRITSKSPERSSPMGIVSPRYRSSDSGEDSRKPTKAGKHRKYRNNHSHIHDRSDPTTAARNKASRERLRRERLNDSFVELTRTLDPEKPMRAEKPAIISDTIRLINNIRDDNCKLSQETLLLKSEVAKLEKEKQELVLQQTITKHQLETAQMANLTLTHPSSHPHLPHQASLGGLVMGVPVSSRLPAMSQEFEAPLRSSSSLPALHNSRSFGEQRQQQHEEEGHSHLEPPENFLISSPLHFSELEAAVHGDLHDINMHVASPWTSLGPSLPPIFQQAPLAQ